MATSVMTIGERSHSATCSISVCAPNTLFMSTGIAATSVERCHLLPLSSYAIGAALGRKS